MSRVFRVPMSEVRAMSLLDIEVLSEVIKEEQDERQRQAQIAARKKARR